MNRFALVPAIGLIASIACAQSTDSEAAILTLQTSMVHLGANESLYLELNGTETLSGKTAILKDSLFWSNTSTLPNQVELIQNRNYYMERRIVGTSELGWSFNFTRHEYGILDYTKSTGNEQQTLFGFVQANSSGSGSYLGRLLRESLLAYAHRLIPKELRTVYRTWSPGSGLQSITTPTKDPFTGYTYTPTVDTEYVAYGLDVPNPVRVVVFEIGINGPVLSLNHIYFADRSLSKSPRVTIWNLAVVPGPIIDPTRFLPETRDTLLGWQQIAMPAVNPFKTPG